MKIPLPFTRYKRMQVAIYALCILVGFLIVRVFKIRSIVNHEIAHPDKNVRAFLELIRWCEGTAGPEGYRTMFTGKLFSGYAHHPNIVNYGGGIRSTAAGAYQFLYKTWARAKAVLGLPDFSPESQDRAAIYLIGTVRKALEDVKAGRLSDAVAKCCKEWASMPYPKTGKSYYGGQPARTLAQIHAKFKQLGGTAIS